VLGGELGGEPVHVVVVAVDGDQGAVVHRGGEDLRALQGGGDQHDRVPAGAGGCRGDRVGEVAGRGAREHGEPELARRGERHSHDTVLERVRGVAGVVLDPQRLHAERGREPVGLDEAGQARVGVRVAVHIGRHGQQVAVAPDRLGPGFDDCAGDVAELVGDLERAEALGTRELGGQRHLVATFPAGQGARGPQVERRGGGRNRHREVLLICPACGSELAPWS